MTSHATALAAHRVRSGGPHPGIIATVSLALMLLALIGAALLAGGKVYVSPFAAAGEISSYFQQNVAAARLSGMLQFGAAVPLGICAATIYARQLRLGIRVPGPAIGLFGGAAAAMFLMISGLLTWTLSRPEISQNAVLAQALTFLSFAAGGVGFVVGLGLMVAGLAVPALILGLVPRWLAWTGLAIAALAELSFLSLVAEPLQFLLPIARFGGMLWLIAAGFLLPVNRARANAGPVDLPEGQANAA